MRIKVVKIDCISFTLLVNINRIRRILRFESIDRRLRILYDDINNLNNEVSQFLSEYLLSYIELK